MLKKFFAKLLTLSVILLPAAALAQDKGTGTAIEALILAAILIAMAGIPLFRRR
jgi:hypothetical protein